MSLLAAILQEASSARGLVLAMLLSYIMCSAGMLFAYLNYRKRQKKDRDEQSGDKES